MSPISIQAAMKDKRRLQIQKFALADLPDISRQSFDTSVIFLIRYNVDSFRMTTIGEDRIVSLVSNITWICFLDWIKRKFNRTAADAPVEMEAIELHNTGTKYHILNKPSFLAKTFIQYQHDIF